MSEANTLKFDILKTFFNYSGSSSGALSYSKLDPVAELIETTAQSPSQTPLNA